MIEKTKNLKAFLKFAAICSFFGALTTALLIFLPNPEVFDLNSQALLQSDKLYLSKLWILFIHPQVNIIASLGVAYLLLKRYPLQIIIGTLFLLLWAFTEIMQQSLLIDALNQIWRPAYLNAEDQITQDMYRTLIKGAIGISDSHYFVVIYGFGLGTLFYGLALIQLKEWAKWIGVALVFIGLLSIISFIRYYLNFGQLSLIVDGAYQWVYPYLQPVVRIALGVWILKEINKAS